MSTLKKFVFNPFQENTYIVYDDTLECIIIDPGCSDEHERNELKEFVEELHLKPVKLINTHCHIDHILGNRFIAESYDLKLEMNYEDKYNLEGADQLATSLGVSTPNSPAPEKNLQEGDTVAFGNTKLKVLFTPGHCKGHISLVNDEDKYVLSGDVLFLGSVGRTDLPGGDMATLLNSINEKLLPLDNDYTVYSGHGPDTTIGFERMNNPFLTNG